MLTAQTLKHLNQRDSMHATCSWTSDSKQGEGWLQGGTW